MIWLLAKSFVAVALVVIFCKWLIAFTGIYVPMTDKIDIAILVIMVSGFLFFIGLSAGLIIGEQSVYKRIKAYERSSGQDASRILGGGFS